MSIHVEASSPPARLGRYRLIAQLGQGGMGTIHLAVAEGIGGFRKLFVVKELKQELSDNEQFLGLFMREAKLAARLNHPNVVHTVEADQDGGRFFLAMEFLDGRPFNEILRRAEQGTPVPLALRLQVICHALAGLHHAHELTDFDGRALHVVHRDVSPANIFVTYDGQVKMLDFGIAKAGDAEGTQPGSFKGKIGYASPEQLRLQPADRRTDVFACGVVLWEAIALRHLVRGKPSRQVFESRLLGTEPRIGQLIDGVDPRLAEICDRAMCREPSLRYPSAEAFHRDLSGFLSERNMSVDASEIAALLRTKFAKERDALHRLIETQLSAEVDADSIVMRRLGPASARAPKGHALSSISERVETGALPSIRPGADTQRQKSSSRVLGSLLLVALAGATAWRLRSDVETTPQRRAEGSAPAAERSAAASSDAARAATSADAGSAEPRWAESLPANAERPKEDNARSSEDAGRARRTLRKPEEMSGSGELLEPARGEPPQNGAPAAPSTGEPAPLDIDLRNVPRPGRRALDVDNPFR